MGKPFEFEGELIHILLGQINDRLCNLNEKQLRGFVAEIPLAMLYGALIGVKWATEQTQKELARLVGPWWKW